MVTKKVKIRLQGHEKFALRDGWINKALKIVPDNSDAFTRKDATDMFGIGSNMVKSLRYWMKVLGLTNTSGSELLILEKSLLKMIHILKIYLHCGFYIQILQKI